MVVRTSLATPLLCTSPPFTCTSPPFPCTSPPFPCTSPPFTCTTAVPDLVLVLFLLLDSALLCLLLFADKEEESELDDDAELLADDFCDKLFVAMAEVMSVSAATVLLAELVEDVVLTFDEVSEDFTAFLVSVFVEVAERDLVLLVLAEDFLDVLVLLDVLAVAVDEAVAVAIVSEDSETCSTADVLSCLVLAAVVEVSWVDTAANAALSDSNLRIASPAERDSSTTPSATPGSVAGLGATGGGTCFFLSVFVVAAFGTSRSTLTLL